MTDLTSFEDYFDEIHTIWKPMNDKGRIISFCTPLIHNPKVLVIGTNHSNNFDPHNPTENNRIADAFSKALPQEHTFLEHNHPFAKGLRDVISKVQRELQKEEQREFPNFELSKEWIGTNRCAIQTGSGGLGSIDWHGEFNSCQKEMDKLLKKFIAFAKPKNVILTGKYACDLFYPKGMPIREMKSEKVPYGEGVEGYYNVIPIMHPSASRRGPKPMVKKIKCAIMKGYCDL